MAKKIFLFLFTVMFVSLCYAEKVVALPELMNPELIRADENQLYITERNSVYIYSLKDFKLVKKFGKAGEGPQEFRVNMSSSDWMLWMSVEPDSLFFQSLGKVSYFSKKGEFIKEIKAGTELGRAYVPLGDNFVGVQFIQEKKGLFWATNIYDADFKKIKEVYRYKADFQPGKKVNIIETKTASFCVYDNKIFIADTVGTGTIDVYDKNGGKLYSIKPEYEKVKVSDDVMQRYREYYNRGRFKGFYKSLKNRFIFPEYFPAMRFITVTDNKIYIMTYKKKEGKTCFLVLDLKGKLLKKAYLPVGNLEVEFYCPYAISNGYLYQVIENEDEEWELRIHRLN